MLPHPSHQLVPNVFAAVSKEHQSIGVEPVPAWLNLPDYHLLPPLLGCTLGNQDDPGLYSPDAFLNPADTIAVLA